MEESVLDQISPVGCFDYYYDGWRNKKIGSISNVNGDCIYRFIETKRGDNGHLYRIHNNNEDNPIVIEGIVGWWLLYRKNPTNRLISDFKDAKIESLAIREQFDKYTELRYKQFKDLHRDDPDTLFWDWDYEFYTKHIIPFEMKLNKTTEALFDYISDSDIVLVRKVMDAYIEFLKRSRSSKGFYVSNDLKVLRSIKYSDEFMLEDLEDFEVNAILDELEGKGYVKVAWTEGHGFEDVRLNDKGRAYMKQLESEVTKTEENLQTGHDAITNEGRKAKEWNFNEEELRKHFKPIFKGDINNNPDKIPELIGIIQTTTTDIGIGQIALQIYDSDYFFKDNYKCFMPWYREFCSIIGAKPNPNFNKSKFKIKDKEQIASFAFLKKIRI